MREAQIILTLIGAAAAIWIFGCGQPVVAPHAVAPGAVAVSFPASKPLVEAPVDVYAPITGVHDETHKNTAASQQASQQSNGNNAGRDTNNLQAPINIAIDGGTAAFIIAGVVVCFYIAHRWKVYRHEHVYPKPPRGKPAKEGARTDP